MFSTQLDSQGIEGTSTFIWKPVSRHEASVVAELKSPVLNDPNVASSRKMSVGEAPAVCIALATAAISVSDAMTENSTIVLPPATLVIITACTVQLHPAFTNSTTLNANSLSKRS
jgi:hypothetical protein